MPAPRPLPPCEHPRAVPAKRVPGMSCPDCGAVFRRSLPPVVRGPQLAIPGTTAREAGQLARRARERGIRGAVERAPGLPALKAQAAKVKRRELRETLEPKATYRQQFSKCGKRCCSKGASHGPYWYLEMTDGTRKKTRYVGKRLPASILEHVIQHGHPAAQAAAAEQLAAGGGS